MNIINQMETLADSALVTGSVVALVEERGLLLCNPSPLSDLLRAQEAGPAHFGPIVGIDCPQGTRCVAYPLDVALSTSRSSSESRVAAVVSREGVAIIVEGEGGRRLRAEPGSSTAIDLGLRAMGLSTPPPDSPLIELMDRIWLDRIMAVAIDSDLGCAPRWPKLAALHPALPNLGHDEGLEDARYGFGGSWSQLRLDIAGARLRWPGMLPEVAGWLDDGSFARWCLADTPDPQPILADLEALLDPEVCRRIRETIECADKSPIETLAADSGGEVE